MSLYNYGKRKWISIHDSVRLLSRSITPDYHYNDGGWVVNFNPLTREILFKFGDKIYWETKIKENIRIREIGTYKIYGFYTRDYIKLLNQFIDENLTIIMSLKKGKYRIFSAIPYKENEIRSKIEMMMELQK